MMPPLVVRTTYPTWLDKIAKAIGCTCLIASITQITKSGYPSIVTLNVQSADITENCSTIDNSFFEDTTSLNLLFSRSISMATTNPSRSSCGNGNFDVAHDASSPPGIAYSLGVRNRHLIDKFESIVW